MYISLLTGVRYNPVVQQIAGLRYHPVVKKVKDSLYRYRYVFAMFLALIVFACLVSPAFAEDAGGSGSTIWSAGQSISKSLVKHLREFYTNSLFLPLIIVLLITFAFTKDEKKQALLKNCILWAIAIFILLYVADLIPNTLKGILTESGISGGGVTTTD